MQLFAVACRRDGSADLPGLEAAVRGAAGHFPQLDGGATVSARSADGRLAVAALSHPEELAGPRRYSARRDQVLTLFDGFPVDRNGRFAAHDAAVLYERWSEAAHSLEGIFSALRVDLGAGTVECLLDVVGMAKVFLVESASGWVLSNSVGALRAACDLDAPDPVGVSGLLALGWPLSRTLVAGIEPLEGGRLHRLAVSGRTEQPYLTAAEVAPRNNAHRVRDAELLVAALRQTSASAVGSVGDVSCPLTAGRDTRVLFALMLSLGRTDLDYYTSGVAGEPDVEISRMLARHAGVEHRLTTPEVPADLDRWAAATARFCAQTDGMATIHGISDHIDHGDRPGPLGLKVWGPGGEIARAGNIGMLIPFASQVPGLRSSWEVQKRVLETKTSALSGVVRPEAVEATRRYLRDFADRRRDEGWRSREVLESYYAFERVRNWASTGVRRVSGATDLFSPYISRDFYEYAFSLSPGERFMEAAHYRLLSVLSPELRDLPFEKPWKPQRPVLAPALAVGGVAGAVRDRLRRDRKQTDEPAAPPPLDFGRAWFEAGLPAHRELCASVPQSPLWDYVDRGRLDAVLSGPDVARSADVEGLCGVLTAFWYFHGGAAAEG